MKIFFLLAVSFVSLSLFMFTHPLGLQSSHANTHSVSMEDTLRLAFAYSPSIKAAQESRQQSVHNVRAEEAGYYPTIGIWAGVGMQQQSTISTRATLEQDHLVGTFNTGMQLNQSLWQGGQTSALVRMREAELNAKAWQLMDSANGLAYSAISAHADVLRRKELVRLSQGNVRENEHILNLLNTLVSQGISSEGDVYLVEGRLARAKASLSAHELGLRQALASYTRITGQPAPKNLQAIAPPKRIITSLEEARNSSINKNILLQTYLANIRAAVADIDVTKSQFSPRVSLSAGPSLVDQGYRGDSRQVTWSAMLNLQWDIYSGGRDVATLQAKRARVRELQATLHQAMDQVNEEIIATHTAIISAQEQSRFYAKSTQSVEEARTNYDAQFKVGLKDLISILDAESEYFFSASEEVIHKIDIILGQYRMLALTGELLEELNITQHSLLVDTSTKDTSTFTPWSFKPTTLDTQKALSGTTLNAPQ